METVTPPTNRKKLERRPSVYAPAAEEIKSSIPVRMIKIELIASPVKHDRKKYSEESIKSLAESIKEKGVLQPIIVRKLKDGTYERIAGFRRVKAVLLNGGDEILAHIIEADDLGALEAMLIENTQREDLNSYDKAVFMEEIIVATMNATESEALVDMSSSDLKKRLNRMRNRKSNTLVADPTEDDILFEETIKAKILPLYGIGIDALVGFINMLDFNELIIDAIKNGKIGRTSGAEINKLAKKHAEHIAEAIERAHSEDMSRRDVEKMIALYLKNKKQVEPDRVKEIGKMLSFNKIPKENRQKAEEETKRFIAAIKMLSTAQGE